MIADLWQDLSFALRGLLFQVDPLDLGAMLGSALALATVAALAAYLPSAPRLAHRSGQRAAL